MAITPTGILSKPLDALADLWAASAKFQELVGLPGDATNTKKRVAIQHLPGADARRPFAVVAVPESYAWQPQRLGAHGTGRLWCQYEADVKPEDAEDPADAAYRFLNDLGTILQEIFTESANGSGRLYVQGFTFDGKVMRAAREESQDYYMAAFFVDFGPRR